MDEDGCLKMAIYEDYNIPAGYSGVLYAADVFLYYEDEYIDSTSGTSLCEYEPTEWYDDLDECLKDAQSWDLGHCFAYPHQNYAYARLIIQGIELDGTEIPGETGWNYKRLPDFSYLGEIIENNECEE